MRKINLSNNALQWLVVISIFQFRLETLVMLLILLTTHRQGVLIYIRFAMLLLIQSVVMLALYGYGMSRPLQQLLLVGIHFIGYYTFFKSKVSSIDEVWIKYLKFCYYVALLGVFQIICVLTVHVNPFEFLGSIRLSEDGGISRLHSIFGEPGYLSVFLLPYIVYSISNFGTIDKKRFWVVLIVFLLTFGAAGYVGLFCFGIYKLMMSRLRLIPLILVPIILICSVVKLNRVDNDTQEGQMNDTLYKIRQTMDAFSLMEPVDFEVLNASTYATMTNLWVSLNAPSRIVGTGIGSHPQTYERLYKSNFHLYGLNKEDAYSAAVRLYSEFGLFGLFIAFFLIFRYHNKANPINVSILFYMVSCLVRGGHYTANGIFFFCMIYYFSSHTNIQMQKIDDIS